MFDNFFAKIIFSVFELKINDKIFIIIIKRPVFFQKLTIHKRNDVPFAYREGVPQCCIVGMSQYKNVCLILNRNEDEQICTDDNYGWAKDDWKTLVFSTFFII